MELNTRRYAGSRGFSLLESLIALVIFSVALLALAGMYAKTLSMSHSTYLRALASIQAMDIEERIRANPKAGTNDYIFACSGNEVVPGSIGGTPSVLAGHDKNDWCARTKILFGDLLQAASVQLVSSAPVDYAIGIAWLERSIRDDNTVEVATETFTYTVRK